MIILLSVSFFQLQVIHKLLKSQFLHPTQFQVIHKQLHLNNKLKQSLINVFNCDDNNLLQLFLIKYESVFLRTNVLIIECVLFFNVFQMLKFCPNQHQFM